MYIKDRFWSKVDKSGKHWMWTGGTNTKTGHGQMRIKEGDGSSRELAHRLSWMIHFGSIPDGLCVLHSCDIKRCVKPKHLFLGTRADNVADMIAKGRDNFGRRPR